MNGQVRNYVNFWELLAGRNFQGSGTGLSIGSAKPVGGGGGIHTGIVPPIGDSPVSGGLGSLSGIWTFGIDDDTVGNDVAAKVPPAFFTGVMTLGYVTVDTPPTTGDFIFDILFSPQNGREGYGWYSMFPPPLSGPLLITDETPEDRMFRSPNFPRFTLVNPLGAQIYPIQFPGNPVKVKAGYIARMDVLQSGGATGITAAIAWAPQRATGVSPLPLTGGSPGIVLF